MQQQASYRHKVKEFRLIPVNAKQDSKNHQPKTITFRPVSLMHPIFGVIWRLMKQN